MTRPRLRWYSVSVDTLRTFGLVLATLAVVAGGWFGYRWWESHSLEREAAALIAQAKQVSERLAARPEMAGGEYAAGLSLLGEAEEAYARESFEHAAAQARRSLAVLDSILDSLAGGEGGEAHFIAVHGNVQLRRRESNVWQEARSRESLAPGDYVRTAANGSAEILFADGTLYTVRPNTSLIVSATRGGDGGAERSITIDYGWVNLSTSRRPIRVDTPEAQARVAEESDAYVAYEQEAERGRFGTLRGSMEVEGRDGERVRVDESQHVVQRGGELSAPRPLLPAPELVAPPESHELSRARDETVVLEWEPVEGARGYRLEVARDSLFVDRVIEDAGRPRTRATLGIRGEGSFEWRVAAEGGDGELGQWSPPRSFRVAALGSGGRDGDNDGDREPPPLEIGEAQGYGNIFIVSGRTEPGAIVEINGESVSVDASGAFNKTIQLTGEGYSFIVVEARDAWGNARQRRQRVYVDAGP
ncbi:MAG TPA: FecR domain-containing protein [Thermoanaerobaculia bacterium]|nr:FecR domain-containing protein [Thermoanaerobaculia bacterium]